MPEAPSLIGLCIGAIIDAIIDGDDVVSFVYELPLDLFDQIVQHLPPLALQNLQDAMPIVNSGECVLSNDGVIPSRKRKRSENFDMAWKALYESRWGPLKKFSEDTNWQQVYWEKHLQNCLDATCQTVPVTLVDGFLGDVELPDSLLKGISYEGHPSRSKSYSKLLYHCERFGQYARCLRLQSVHYVAEVDRLLGKCQLEFLEIHWLKSKKQVEGLCKLLKQKKETLASLEFINCKLNADLVTAICESLHVKGFETNVINKFSITGSSFLDSSFFPLPHGLKSLLTAARRGLTTLALSENLISWKTAKMLFDTLVNAESGLQVLDLSDNNIAGWLSHLKWGSVSCIDSDHQGHKSMKSLRVLNLRSNQLQKDDADCLKYALLYLPNLEVLNLSDNPLRDDGIRNLILYLIQKSKCKTPLTELYLDKCGIACHGASHLLKVLAECKVPLKSLSIGHNYLSRDFGESLGRFISSGIQALDVKNIGMDPTGFSDAHKEISGIPSLVRINLSYNKGGDGIAHFLSKLVSRSPELVSVDASGNWIPVESFPAICSCLKAAKGKLEDFNLMQNPLCGKPDIKSLLAEFQINGKPNISLSTPPPQATTSVLNIYDDDV